MDHLTTDDSLTLGHHVMEWPTRRMTRDDMDGKQFVCVNLKAAVPKEDFNQHFCPDIWRPRIASEACKKLLNLGFEAVMFLDVVEIIAENHALVMPNSSDKSGQRM